MAGRSMEVLFGSVSMIAMAALPFGTALGLRVVGRPVAWIPALIISTAIAIAVCVAVAMAVLHAVLVRDQATRPR